MLALTQRNNILYLELVYLVTALVPSDTACLASSPGKRSLTAVWISLEVMVDLLLQWARRLASAAILSKRSFTNEFMILMALEETPSVGMDLLEDLVDVDGVGLLPLLAPPTLGL